VFNPNETIPRYDITTSRYDIYAAIHKGLRHRMGSTLYQVGRADATDDAEFAAALEQVRELLHVCRKHLQHENDFVHVALERIEPGSSARIAMEHVDHLRDIDALATQLVHVEQSVGGKRALQLHTFYRQLAQFVAHNYEHMEYEEREHNATLQRHLGDAEIESIERALVASIAPPDLMVILHWMLPALSHVERSGMLADMRAGAPAEVFAAVMALARAQLPAADWHKLEQSLLQAA